MWRVDWLKAKNGWSQAILTEMSVELSSDWSSACPLTDNHMHAICSEHFTHFDSSTDEELNQDQHGLHRTTKTASHLFLHLLALTFESSYDILMKINNQTQAPSRLQLDMYRTFKYSIDVFIIIISLKCLWSKIWQRKTVVLHMEDIKYNLKKSNIMIVRRKEELDIKHISAIIFSDDTVLYLEHFVSGCVLQKKNNMQRSTWPITTTRD